MTPASNRTANAGSAKIKPTGLKMKSGDPLGAAMGMCPPSFLMRGSINYETGEVDVTYIDYENLDPITKLGLLAGESRHELKITPPADE